MVQRKSFNLSFARTAGMLSGARRVAMLLMTLLLTMTAQTAWAQDPILVTEVPEVDNGNWVISNEDHAKLVDGNLSTKYFMNANPYVEFHYTKAFVPKAYILWTKDENGTRNPASWIIKAKLNVGDQWTTIATVDNSNGDKLTTANNASTEFSFEGNTNEYRFFRFEATTANSGSNAGQFQLAELQFKKEIEDPNNLQDATITGINSRYLYTGSAIIITPVVTAAGGSALSLGTDFTATLGSANVTAFPFTVTNEDDYTLTVTGTGTQGSGYYGSQTFNFSVVNCPEGLSIDDEYTKGQDGFYYVNMPATGTNTLTLSDASITSFKVYDDGGKGGNYSNKCSGYLTLTAPTGYMLQLSGTIQSESADNLTVYDGSTTSGNKLLDAIYSTTTVVQTPITIVTSTGNSMMLYFKSDGSDNYSGLDLTVTLVEDNTKYNITVSTATGGTINSDKTEAKVNETVTLTATPSSGYMVSDLMVKDANNNTVAVSGGWYSNNQATFTMPGSAVTVTPTFTNNLTSLYINMPKTGTKTATIPSGVTSFKVYDDGGANKDYSLSCDGYLILTAPTGYAFQLSGTIQSESADNLTVYDGSTTSANKLLDAVSSTTNGSQTAITTVYSTGQSMLLYFYSDENLNDAGLDLTVTLIPALSETTGITGADAASLRGKNERFSRTFTASVSSTLCLPFPMTGITGGTAYEFTAMEKVSDVWTATMSAVTSTEAGKPYLFMASADGAVSFSGTVPNDFTGVAASSAPVAYSGGGTWTFCGTYTTLTYGTNLDGAVYGFAGAAYSTISAGDFVKAETGAYVPPFRCYLRYTAPSNARGMTRGADIDLPSRIIVRLVGLDGQTTAIGSMDTKTSEVSFDGSDWYTLEGRRLSGKPTQKGVYINNGKKVILK